MIERKKQYKSLRKIEAEKRSKTIASLYNAMRRMNLDKGVIISIIRDGLGVSRQTIYNAVNVRQYEKAGNAGEQPVTGGQ